MATYNDVLITSDWTDIFSGAGFTAGTGDVIFQNKGFCKLLLSFTDSTPTDNDYGTIIATGDKITIPVTCNGLWAKTPEKSLKAWGVLESRNNYNTCNSLPEDIYTSTIGNVRRLSVDSQPTSFEENTQFRFIDTWEDVSNTDSILYLFEQTAPIVIFSRDLSLYTGGRSYYVIPYDESDTYTGTQETLTRVPLPLNGLLRDGLTEHPDSNVTITRYTVTAFTHANEFIEMSQVIAPTSGLTKVAGDYSSESLRFGTETCSESDPLRYWIYLPNLESTDDSNGYWKLCWEERVN